MGYSLLVTGIAAVCAPMLKKEGTMSEEAMVRFTTSVDLWTNALSLCVGWAWPTFIDLMAATIDTSDSVVQSFAHIGFLIVTWLLCGWFYHKVMHVYRFSQSLRKAQAE